MARWLLELIKDEMYNTKPLDEYVLFNSNDILFLLEIIEIAEDLARLNDVHASQGCKISKALQTRWQSVMGHEV